MDYVSYYLSYPYPGSLLLLILLGTLRLAPIVVMAPYYGAKILPPIAKMGLVLALSLVFLPQLLYLTGQPLQFDLTYVGYCLKELFIGVVIGFMVSIPFYIATSSGTLIDHQRGVASFMILDPSLQVQASPIGLFYNYVLIFIFYAIGGAGYFLDSVSASYNIIPPDRWLSASFFGHSGAYFWKMMVGILGEIMRIASQLAAPPLVAMFMSDLFLGIANRLSPQVPMSFLGWALKALVGMAVLWAAWQFISIQLELQTVNWLKMIDSLLPQLKPA